MAITSHSYRLGKDHTFTFSNGVANIDVKSVTLNRETSAEAEITTRASDTYQEFVPVRQNTVVEVVVLNHTCVMHGTGVLAISHPSGGSISGTFYVNGISEPQDIDGAVETTLTFRKYAGV